MTLGIEYTWYRQFSDGRVEHEFDPDSGAPTKWGAETPSGIVEVGWIPMTMDLARKIVAYGERGVPTRGPVMCIKVPPGEIPVASRERTIRKGGYVTCKICGDHFLAPEPPSECPYCRAEPEEGKISPFDIQQAEWEEAVYEIGIKGGYLQRFTPQLSVTQ